jgi:hypothetical protein
MEFELSPYLELGEVHFQQWEVIWVLEANWNV